MTDIERAAWLADKLHNGGDHGKEAAALLVQQANQIERLQRAMHEIAEEWAGAECGEPVHAQEAYAIGLAKRMYSLAVEARTPGGKRCTAAHLCDCQEAGQLCALGLGA
jgi:hypothetical protein